MTISFISSFILVARYSSAGEAFVVGALQVLLVAGVIAIVNYFRKNKNKNGDKKN